MGRTLATLLTITTYGVWLRGDARGWVEDGVVYPPDPVREMLDAERMKYPPFRFPKEVRFDTAHAIGRSLVDRLNQRIFAMCLQSWHTHIVIGATTASIPDIVKCAKDAARWHLRPGRPIWGVGYDKRFCFDLRSVENRIQYVERHNLEEGLPARPWDFISEFDLRG